MRIVQAARASAVRVCGTAVFSLAASLVVYGGVDAYDRAATDDPVAIADRALSRSFNREVADREISAASPRTTAILRKASSNSPPTAVLRSIRRWLIASRPRKSKTPR